MGVILVYEFGQGTPSSAAAAQSPLRRAQPAALCAPSHSAGAASLYFSALTAGAVPCNPESSYFLGIISKISSTSPRESPVA